MRTILVILFVLFTKIISAQSNIINEGVIVYEEKTNTHKQFSRYGEGEWFEQMKDKIPKYKVVNYDLVFNAKESIYKKSATQPPEDMNMPLWMRNQDDKTTETYKNLETNIIDAQKYIMEQLFLIHDTIQSKKWKITDEFRIIAGYNCRRATTIIDDSVYAIAFYTDAIVPSNGPLAFGGLPGTILGLVLPKFNVTYFAKEVKTEIPTDQKIIAPNKGEKITYKKAIETVDKNANDGWMKKFKNDFIWNILL